MKILHITAQLPGKTGSGIYFDALINSFKDKHQQACIFALQDNFTYKGLEGLVQYPVCFKSGKLDFPIVGMSDEMPYESEKYSDLSEDMIKSWRESFSKKITKALESFKPDLIICHHLWMLTSLVCELKEDITTVGICHGTDIRQAHRNPDLKENHVNNLKELDKVFLLSQSQIEDVEKSFDIRRERTYVLGGGFDSDIFYPGDKPISKDKIRFVYAGKFSKSKGIYELIRAFNNLRKEYSDVELVLVGARDESQAKEFKSMCKEGVCEIYAQVSQKELSRIYRSCHIFVLPSYFEGLGLSAVEALACGLHLVASKNDGLMEFLPGELLDSRLVSMVDLPRLRNEDEPLAEDLPKYVADLKTAMEEQAYEVREGKDFRDKVYSLAWENSWDNLGNKLLKEINN